jgi:hypothetical protein
MTEPVDTSATIDGVQVVPLRRIPDVGGTILSDVSLVANCATHPHDPSRSERLDPNGPQIPLDWVVRNR